MLSAERKATVSFVPSDSRVRPVVPVANAKTDAACGDISFRTSGLFRVRDIIASYLGSMSILRVFADAEDKNVPVVRKRSVKVDVESVVGDRSDVALIMSGIGYSE